jgi:hypothetical protein
LLAFYDVIAFFELSLLPQGCSNRIACYLFD